MNNKYQSLIAVALLCLLVPATPRAESINIAAIVNETVITTTDLNERRDLAMALNGVEPTAENQQRATPRVLQSLIEEALQLEEAKRLSVSVTDDDIAKAISATEESKGQAPGSMLGFIEKNGLSKRSLEAQLRANIAWTRVVQRKLRRNVSVSEDEIQRAQQTEAADPGVHEVRVASINVPVRTPKDAERMSALAETMAHEIETGASMGSVALKYTREGIQVTPPRWMAEEKLPPGLQQSLRSLKNNELLPPLRVPEGYQLLQLLDRRVTKPLPESTEIVLKDIQIPAPTTPSKEAMEKFRQQTLEVRANPGSCMDTGVGVPSVTVEVDYVRAQMGALPEELRSIVTHLAVTEISEPLMSPRAIRMVMLCEKIEPATTALADADKVRQKLFGEKLELEAAKRMRDLKRDAFIDVKAANAS